MEGLADLPFLGLNHLNMTFLNCSPIALQPALLLIAKKLPLLETCDIIMYKTTRNCVKELENGNEADRMLEELRDLCPDLQGVHLRVLEVQITIIARSVRC